MKGSGAMLRNLGLAMPAYSFSKLMRSAKYEAEANAAMRRFAQKTVRKIEEVPQGYIYSKEFRNGLRDLLIDTYTRCLHTQADLLQADGESEETLKARNRQEAIDRASLGCAGR